MQMIAKLLNYYQ